MRTPTPEQQRILDSDARVRVVRAAPGSGKTWLVAEVIRQALADWPTGTGGIAALSFTRVGGDEIRSALGRDLAHPHFVGTIDAFLFRFVVRPPLRGAFNWSADPRLVPGEWGAEHWSKYRSNQSATVGEGINLFSCVYIGEEQERPVVAHKPHPAQPLRPLSGDDLLRVNAAKKKMWEQHGLLTHSDAALWASRILEHPTFGPVVRGEIVRRFPFLIVDELQDTGHFLGKSIRLLLGEPSMRGVLVGDPDQAIYEFTGARPSLFNTFEVIDGATSIPLASSRRCPAAVVGAAVHVKDSPGKIGSAEGRVGRALLLRYKGMVTDVRKVADAVHARDPMAVVKVIARASTTVEELSGQRSENASSLYCRPLTHLHRAVSAFRRGRNNAALASARAAIELATFEHEGVSDEELAAANIDPRDWKQLAVRCLLGANAVSTTSTHFGWHASAGEILDEEIGSFDLGPSLSFSKGNLKPQKRTGWERASADFLPKAVGDHQAVDQVPVQTVHGVKGETHDTTVVVCPPIATAAHCPSVIWWSSAERDREEKRIAYVAMTRSRDNLIVCVSDACYQRLTDKHPGFVASFECMSVDEYAAGLGDVGPD